jgi:peptidoglycan/xylan/chitin deacetylase (PgdA/CDA1 family)
MSKQRLQGTERQEGARKSSASGRRVAITVDDLPGEPFLDVATLRAMTERLVEALALHGASAVGFVTGKNVLVREQIDERVRALNAWLDGGHLLGNHTYSHTSLNESSLADYQTDVIQGELLVRFALEPRGERLRYFRAPHNHIAPTREIKAALEHFVRTRRQVLTPFTVEHSDYAFDRAFVAAEAAVDAERAERVRSAYLSHLDTVFDFFEGLSERIFRRQIAQILLVHANRLNAVSLDEMLERIEARGYEFISLSDALEDEAYSMPDHFVGPAGISWFHRWSFSRGYGSRTTTSGLTLPETLFEEPDPPQFILDASRS